MADAAVKTMISGRNRVVLDVTGVYSGGDSDTNILDISTFTGPSGAAATKATVEEIWWSVSPNYEYVMLEWDATTDARIETMSNSGYIDYRPFGGKSPDTTAGGFVGDILLTTAGGEAGDAFSILISVRIKD